MDGPSNLSAAPPSMQTALRAIWLRSLPETRARIALLQRAATELVEANAIAPPLLTEALSVAHKLAGSLGMFGFHTASGHARAIEEQLSLPHPPQPELFARHVQSLSEKLPLNVTGS